MAQKTWLPALLKLLIGLCNYLNRNRLYIGRILPDTAEPAIDDVIAACLTLSAIIEPFIPPET
jgi:hypothetical protein